MKKKPLQSTVFVYDAPDGWRWHRVAPNGRIVSESGEAYVRRYACIRMATQLNPGTKIEISK